MVSGLGGASAVLAAGVNTDKNLITLSPSMISRKGIAAHAPFAF
jgi:hypothetical protein